MPSFLFLGAFFCFQSYTISPVFSPCRIISLRTTSDGRGCNVVVVVVMIVPYYHVVGAMSVGVGEREIRIGKASLLEIWKSYGDANR